MTRFYGPSLKSFIPFSPIPSSLTLFVLSVLLLISTFAPLSAKEFSLDQTAKKSSLGKYIEYLEDSDKKLTIADVSEEPYKKKFQLSDKNTPSFGFSSSAFWFRLTIHNPLSDNVNLFLEIKNPYLDRIYFFKPDGNGDWIEKRTGELLPFETRELKRATFIFPLSIPKQNTETYFFRFEGESSFEIPIFLYDYTGLYDAQYWKSIHMGFYFGIISIMMLTSLFLFLQIRDLSLLYYFLYLAALALVFANYKGLTAQYIWSEYSHWANQGFFVFYSLTHIFFLLFTRAFLDTSKNLHFLDNILHLEICILAACIIPGIYMPYRVGVQFLMICTIIYQITALVAGTICLIDGRKSAGYFLIAFTPMVLSSILFILLKMNYLSNSKLVADFFQVNHFFKLSLLSLAIIARVRLLYDEKKEALEKVNLVKDDFLAKTSHELRTPLHGIIGITETLKDQASANNFSQSVIQQLNVIMAASKRLVSLVNDILDVSRIKNKEINLSLNPVDVHQLTEIVLTLCRTLTIGKEVELINAIPKSLPPVMADEDRLQQIMNNLVGNAIKFTERGEIKITAEAYSGRVRISVQDSGIGIPEDHFDRIFSNFEQVNTTGTVYSQGTGLGLSIVKRLVELHGGTVKVVSEPGKGSVFSFDLALSDSPANHSQTLRLDTVQSTTDEEDHIVENTTNSKTTQNNYNVLVVDDEPINLHVVTGYLAELGFNIQVVTSGEGALTEIAKTIPDLVLLDIMMPNMSGFEVCKKIREQYPTSKVVIIFLTAKNQVSDLVEGFSLGANDYLSKPFSKTELLTRVRYHLENYQMANRLVSLTKFSCRLSKLKDLRKVFHEAFNLICKQLAVSDGILIAEGEIISKTGESADKLASVHFMLDREREPDEITSHLFHTSEALLISPRFFKDFELLIIKENHQVFTELDVEFIRNILTTVKVTRDNLREIISDASLLSGLHQIRKNLQSVTSIKAQRNYCTIICDDPNNMVFDLRISIQKIQTYFKDSELLKINRSTLVNPTKVHSVKKMAKQKYSVIMTDGENLPISRSLEKPVRRFFERN